jgi:anti-sigma-K factor RskA
MSAPSHDEYRENIGAYVLGALPEQEAELLERHLASCDECRAEVEDLRPATAAMLRSVPQVEPPASLKTSLMRTVNAEAELRAGAAERPARERRPRRLFEGLTPRLATGLAVAVLALGVAIGIGVGQLGGGGGKTTTVTAHVDRRLMPTGTAVLKVSGDKGRLSLKDAPSPPGGRVYQLWYQHGKMIERGGTFKPKPDGSYDATVPVTSGTDAVMVTVERAGGAPAPTGPPVLRFNV